ncbi:hypothetical protein AVEN_124020-1 [Araneus ventricosus]|uniref:Uncharacterized protein n=1 Tax=Araneus ventricosus TaxID=182803 RepID=A0A4Y2L0S9_ARAVE|nr:hypothetical protein AVEN_124020-1 [Araneus ventricosus]
MHCLRRREGESEVSIRTGSLVNASSGIFTTSLGQTGRRPSLLEDTLVEVDHCPPPFHPLQLMPLGDRNSSASVLKSPTDGDTRPDSASTERRKLGAPS